MSIPARDFIAACRSELRAGGLRATKPAIAVLQRLRATSQPLTHSELSNAVVLDDGATLDRVTLYRVLQRLIKAGLVAQFPGLNGTAHFTIPRPDALGHFECSNCHRVVRLFEGALSPAMVEQVREELQRQGIGGAQVSLVIAGSCPQCHTQGHARMMMIAGRPEK